MKYLIFLFLILCMSRAAFGQVLNPTIISQDTDILLQNTDVYYCPFAPPELTDIRDSLSNQYSILMDPNGVGNPYVYIPKTHDTLLYLWQPCGQPLGVTTTWQRLFTAKRKPSGATSNIIAGGGAPGTRVTVSKNEDVDFRASGRIILKSGFHVKPGAFFHAYTEPKWDTTVFSDEFDSTALDRSKWYVGRGWGEVNAGAECSSDSNVRDTLDPDAHDGHALDVILREDTGGCSCQRFVFNDADECLGTNARDTTLARFIFSSAALQSCPGLWLQADSPFTPMYQHAPYGKYEIREKIPHVLHNTNNWGFGAFEWDMGETYPGENMTERNDGFVLNLRSGPFKGTFGRHIVSPGDTLIVFRSEAAQFSNVNIPTRIFIDNFLYNVYYQTTATDAFMTAAGSTPAFPLSLANSGPTDTFSFYYERSTNNIADSLTWTVDTASDGKWRIFSATYHDSSGVPLYFSKSYQPTSVTLSTIDTITDDTIIKPYACHWDHTLNKIWLDDAMDSTAYHSNTEKYPYVVSSGAVYPVAPIAFDGNDTTGGYVYHTYTMELLPHEMRFLVDGNVVRRFPDRLVPRNCPYYDRISDIMRFPTYILPAEVDIDYGSYIDSLGVSHTDSLGVYPGTNAYVERKYFEAHATGTIKNPGCWDVQIPSGSGPWYHAAHHLIDYVKVWDVPKDVKIPNFPQ